MLLCLLIFLLLTIRYGYGYPILGAPYLFKIKYTLRFTSLGEVLFDTHNKEEIAVEACLEVVGFEQGIVVELEEMVELERETVVGVIGKTIGV